MSSPEQRHTLTGRILRAVAAWAGRGRQLRKIRRVEADLRDFSAHVRRDIGLDR